ncbi:MAG: DinB family protein [Candidatus Eisenbacteria bacterium]|uniref:DinB family protein n=1 Tax=Eiseniibacteriota bacterium TaxID=2212470 RepID=A0A7Y2E930_UNCEI|nr:DinB family protein [Candidatus Eisenbacteria bacterium]
MSMIARPEVTEYHQAYQPYVEAIPTDNLLEALESQLVTLGEWLQKQPASVWDHRYEEGKWSVKEVLAHILDTEWVFTYRALRFARGLKEPLPGVDQDELIAGGNFDQRPPASLLEEFGHLRRASLVMFKSLTPEALLREGTASDCQFTSRALVAIIAGHAWHHRNVLVERYGLQNA